MFLDLEGPMYVSDILGRGAEITGAQKFQNARMLSYRSPLPFRQKPLLPGKVVKTAFGAIDDA